MGYSVGGCGRRDRVVAVVEAVRENQAHTVGRKFAKFERCRDRGIGASARDYPHQHLHLGNRILRACEQHQHRRFYQISCGSFSVFLRDLLVRAMTDT